MQNNVYKYTNVFSFWGFCPQTPHIRGFASGPHWGPEGTAYRPHYRLALPCSPCPGAGVLTPQTLIFWRRQCYCHNCHEQFLLMLVIRCCLLWNMLVTWQCVLNRESNNGWFCAIILVPWKPSSCVWKQSPWPWRWNPINITASSKARAAWLEQVLSACNGPPLHPCFYK